MKKKIIIKFLGLQFSRWDPIFQKLMGPRTPFWKCLAPTLPPLAGMQPCITGAADRLLTGNARMSDFENGRGEAEQRTGSLLTKFI